MWQPAPPVTPLQAQAGRDSRPHAVIIGRAWRPRRRHPARCARLPRDPGRCLGRAGGRAAPWRQDGFLFDAGPTIITAPFLLESSGPCAGASWPMM